MRKLLSLLVIVLATSVAPASQSADAPRSTFASDRLARIDQALQQYSARTASRAWLRWCCATASRCYERAVGWRDKEAGLRMTTDTIFRIASQTKAITSAAILMLRGGGKDRL